MPLPAVDAVMLLRCPWCGPRDASEFRHVGEVTRRPDPATATQEQWRAYLYLRSNPCGWVRENWYHRAGCRQYFAVERHTLTHQTRPVTDGGTTPVRGATERSMGSGAATEADAQPGTATEADAGGTAR